MTDHATAESTTLAARLHRRLRAFEPMYLALLGLLAIPSYVFESLAALEIFEAFFLFFLWPFVAPLVEAVVRRGTDEDEAAEPTDWIHMGDWREYAVWILTLPVTLLNPFVLAQDVMQWFGSAVAFARHRGSVPDAASYEQRRTYRLPFDGDWTIVNGSYDHDYSHSWFPLTQRYAYDFVITDADGRTRPEDADSSVDGYYCYDEPILAPADGVVVDVFDGDLESSRAGGFSHPLKRDIRGNYVVIQHDPDEYSCLAHLVPGSVTVAPGDRVDRGQQVGRCGHSGNSSEPHLHFQVQDHPDFEVAAGLPVAFDDVAVEWPGVEAPITDPLSDAGRSTEPDPTADGIGGTETDATGNPAADATDHPLEDGTYHRRAHLTAGQRVAHVERDDAPSDSSPSRGDGDLNRDRVDAHDGASVADDAGVKRPSSRPHAGIAALQRVVFGACVGGAATFFASIFFDPLAVAVLLGAVTAVVAADGARSALLRRGGTARRAGSIGAVAGIGLVAAVVVWTVWADPAIGVGTGTLGMSILLFGFVGYALLGEYDRLQLRDSFPDIGGPRPS